MASLVTTSRITLQCLWSLCSWLCYSCTLYCCILLEIYLLLLLPHWWQVKISSGKGLVPSGDKPLSQVLFRCHRASLGHNEWRDEGHDAVIKCYWPFVRGIHRGPGEFPAQRPVTRSFNVFFDLCLNKWLSKRSWGWWFESLSRPLWRHCNAIAIDQHYMMFDYGHLFQTGMLELWLI